VKRFTDADGALFRQTYGIGFEEKIVLCVSRIDRQKNQMALVRAFADFALTRPDYRLVLIGGIAVESYREELQQEITRLGLAGKITFIEGLRADDPLLPSAYKASEMFVLPSWYEPFGIVVLEAWAAGIPVIASRVGGIPGFASDGRNVLLNDPGDVNGLKCRMEQLADDAGLREELARNAFSAVAYYDWSRVVDQMRTVYAQVVSGRVQFKKAGEGKRILAYLNR
jgi:glycosyltransferase involved in cell wall biosynthesis